MSVRNFDPGDFIQVGDGGVGSTTQAFTHVALFQTDETGGSDRPVISVGSGGGSCTMGRSSGSVAYYDNSEAAYPAVGLGITAATWFVVAMSKAAGVTTPRFHAKQLGSGSWVHSSASGTVDPDSETVDRIRFACFTNGSADFDGRIAVAALFTSALSDGVIESIETNASTAFLLSLSPFAAWELNQASVATDVLDLIGSCDQTSITGTDVVEGVDPAWSFGLVADTGLAWISA